LSDVFILDVGHGNCTIVQNGGEAAVIDAPPRSILIDMLEELKIDHVDYALISHADADHLQGIYALLTSERVSVGHLYLNPDADKESKAWRDLLAAIRIAQKNGHFETHTSLTQSEPGELTVGDIVLRVVSPSPALALSGVGGKSLEGKTTTANTLSAVVKVERTPGNGVLVAGDMDATALADLLETGTDLSASALLYPHHGGLPGSGDVEDFIGKLLGLVKPQQVYVSNDRNKHNNPRAEVVRAIRKHGCTLACTQLAKACGAAVKNDALEKWPSAGRDRNHCCAGTVSLRLTEAGAMRDRTCSTSFREFVDQRVATPMCAERE
jgi:competence protein ComEC